MPPKGGFKKKVAPSDGTVTPHVPSLAEQFSYLHNPRPFKNPNYTKNINRRAKNLKTVLGQDRERDRAERERRKQEILETQPGFNVEDFYEVPTYALIESPPYLMPQRHFCDITGLEAPYTDPATGLRYHDKSVYAAIQSLSPSTVKEYLSARGVNSIVK
ncbi:hypothetical protein FA15DRAFT_669462 [Coprinopsis marcescibilis]|uniref:Vps72/YL1 C-terminal domain-containing protein n=1 Tax=Coprinopsis marcescibilis TaxID=230819 RepID=A0A5C3KXM6_COPMA|nr:hypothetical protein FA15DRAFT_669462 [Coprinopsis marcescibilis]